MLLLSGPQQRSQRENQTCSASSAASGVSSPRCRHQAVHCRCCHGCVKTWVSQHPRGRQRGRQTGSAAGTARAVAVQVAGTHQQAGPQTGPDMIRWALDTRYAGSPLSSAARTSWGGSCSRKQHVTRLLFAQHTTVSLQVTRQVVQRPRKSAGTAQHGGQHAQSVSHLAAAARHSSG